jgi:hypothetical protein
MEAIILHFLLRCEIWMGKPRHGPTREDGQGDSVRFAGPSLKRCGFWDLFIRGAVRRRWGLSAKSLNAFERQELIVQFVLYGEYVATHGVSANRDHEERTG